MIMTCNFNYYQVVIVSEQLKVFLIVRFVPELLSTSMIAIASIFMIEDDHLPAIRLRGHQLSLKEHQNFIFSAIRRGCVINGHIL